MHALLLTLAGFLIGLAVIWGVLLWAIRFRPHAKRRTIAARSGHEGPMTAAQLAESWHKTN